MTSRMWAVQDARVYARRRADGLVWRVMPVILRHLHRRLSQTAFSECALTSDKPRAPSCAGRQQLRGQAGPRGRR